VDEASKHRHDELLQTFQAVDACLAGYYAGRQAIYRPLAGQLRLLYCDRSRRGDHSLLARCFSGLELAAVKRVEWIPAAQLSSRTDILSKLRVTAEKATALQVAKMPFTVTTYANGLAVADLDIVDGAATLPLDEWLGQDVTIHPGRITIREVISATASQGGGVHLDDNAGRQLRRLKQLRPAHIGSDILFVVAIARFTQAFGGLYAQFRDRIGYDGDIASVEFDPEHPVAKRTAQIDPGVTGPALHVESLFGVKNVGPDDAIGVKVGRS
jgi:hypothetical protein